MKKFFAIVLTAIFLVVALVQWHSYRAAESSVSANQIFIHGTPVCVFTKDGNIMARVGECPDGSRMEKGAPKGAPEERAPFHGHPGMKLPPGHPPVDRDIPAERRRTVPI